jgi:hypothetical protein
MERSVSTLDEIAQERRRIADRLARLEEERATLAEELGELDAAERVLLRLTRAPRAEQSAPQRSRPRQRARQSEATSGTPSLGDATLRAIEALGSNVSPGAVRAYLESEYGMRVRPNHLGMALQRHRRAGRLEQRNTHWSLRRPATGT